MHNTLCSPRPLFFLFLPLGRRLEASHSEANAFLKLCLPHSSIQTCPTDILTAPCRGIRSSRSYKPKKGRHQTHFPRQASLTFCTAATCLAAHTELTTIPPSLSKAQNTPWNMGQVELTLSASPPASPQHNPTSG